MELLIKFLAFQNKPYFSFRHAASDQHLFFPNQPTHEKILVDLISIEPNKQDGHGSAEQRHAPAAKQIPTEGTLTLQNIRLNGPKA